MAFVALLDPSAGSFPLTTCLVVFPLLCPTVKMHTHITTRWNRRNTRRLITLPEAKGSLLTLDTESGTFANSLCGCLTQCCACFHEQQGNSARLDWCDKKPVTLQHLDSVSMASIQKLEGSSDFLDHRSLGFVGGKEIQRGMINL